MSKPQRENRLLNIAHRNSAKRTKCGREECSERVITNEVKQYTYFIFISNETDETKRDNSN